MLNQERLVEMFEIFTRNEKRDCEKEEDATQEVIEPLVKADRFLLVKIALFVVWCAELIGIFIVLICFREIQGIFWECVISLTVIAIMFVFTSLRLGKIIT